MRQIRLLNTTSIVFNGHHQRHLAIFNPPDKNAEDSFIIHGLDGIPVDVQKSLLQHRCINTDQGNIVFKGHLYLNAMICQSPFCHGQSIFQNLSHITEFYFRCRRPGIDQNIIDQFFKMFYLPFGDFEPFQIIPRWLHAFFQNLKTHFNGGQRISDLMGDAG